ncbi:STAS domain-containing protein [Rubrivivax gelatinosus]|uniref:RsbT antagonist protein RsbS n=1 Tax=Rubrivivax gelatinosus TaxID=28068 RepID=A0A4R2M872_RUBGE|nr:STAS domain-containing protein [Rubrivivax gelatinosus]MBK1688823.1 anti-anti-sigma factor [Rubrivivax gelatinosus]TCP02852.1 rsbT antagonist protein RsbS [Rubrivivax gelatinosus]
MRVPILRLNARVLLVALGADITDEGVMDFQAALTERAATMQARGVVIDVSALDLIDSFMARVLNDSARMLRLLGAEVVVCGIQPAVAMTLVEMGSRLVDVRTSFTLERALAQLDGLMARALDPPAPGADEPPRHA